VSVEGPQDKEGILHAQNIRLEKSAPAEAAQSGTAEEKAAAPATTDAPPAVSDPNDPGPPVLKRGVQARTAVSDDKPVSYDKGDDKEEAASEQTPAADPVIEKARVASEAFSQKLPNYVCTEFMARFQSESRPVDWRPLDVVSTEVVYEGTKESYRNIQINGKAVHKTIEEIGGAWSTGEFGTTLRDLFSPATGAEFHFRRQGTSGGMTGRVYDFTVERPRSHWHVQLPSQSINPAYRGAVWIEPSSGRVLRIEIQARALPKEFPVNTVESAIDYQKVRIGGGDYLLPVHAESLSCERGTSYCSRNTIDFRNYHKYEADSSITFAKE
jgi:hypothetical protein